MKTTENRTLAESTYAAQPCLNQSKDDAFFSLSKTGKPFFGSSTVQPKLEIGSPDDKFEKQAEQVADTVMQMPDTPLQRKCKECEEKDKLQRKPEAVRSPGGTKGSATLSNQLNSNTEGGKLLPGKIQTEMGSKIGANFKDVHIHTDQKAIQMNQVLGAKAFTHGSDIYFNKGQYDPASYSGKHLLAHELTHVVQQQGVETGEVPHLQREENEEGFSTYFKDCMESLGLPVPSSLFSTVTSATATIAAINTAVAKFGTEVTIAELVGAGTLSEGLLAAGAVTASFYAGAAAGCLATATGQSLSGGYGLGDALYDAIGPEPGLWIADTFGI